MLKKLAATAALSLAGIAVLAAPAQADRIVWPSVEFKHECTGATTVTLNNPTKKTGVVFAVNGDEYTVDPESTEVVVVPADEADDVEVKLTGAYDPTDPPSDDVSKSLFPTKWTDEWEQPKDCPQPTAALNAACAGFTVTVTNPAGNPALHVLVQQGDQSVELDVPAGGSKTTGLVVATAPAAVKVSFTYPYWTEQPESVELTYAAKANCPPATTPPVTQPPAPGNGGGSELPLTGASAGTAVGVGAVLIALGVGVWLVARRRRVTFTT